ncbi:AP-5 complex subunit zeta-1 isoform X2 [Boleophthalmus pectinirostris]|uniref:AP-5 complex subunit zeta-1 isoform X2 n=1 Tax=Boleophthalmus pectinirostris TaxID=150288 RepID=UPI00243187BD|nr:AP-5 complex subunit zeta-1 isoform X2 [Boleophthalmus pectinirostris]
MYSHGSESLIKQARDIQESELQKFYSRLLKLLQGKDLGHEAVDSLQRLHLILSATKFTRKLPPELHKKIFSLLSSPSEQFQILGSAVLRETLPLFDQDVNCIQNNPSVLNSHVAGLLLAQTSCSTSLLPFCAQLVRSLESRHSEALSHSQTHTLPILNSILTHRPECLTEDQVTILSKKLVDWLRYASITQAVSPGGFFSGSRSRQPCPIAELDGTVSGDFFTVLCVGQGFTEDQWMNVHSFSILRNWLLTYHSVSNCNNTADTAATRLQYSLPISHSHSLPTDDRSVDGSVISMVSATSSSSRLLPPKERLREKSFQYCQRLIEQSDRKAQRKADSDLQKACLVEAVCILDALCLEDCSLVYRVFPCIKALYGRLSSDLSYARVLLPIAQFYFNHGEMAAVDCECMWQLVFSRFPAELFNDPLLAHEFLRFVRQNIQNIPAKVPQYTRSFPNLLKFLAWDSPAMVDDYVDLLPSMVTTGTAVELLHTLLDLPCLSATLVLQQRSVLLPITEPSTRGIQAIDAFRNPTFRGLFLFLLRNEAGSGDTIDRLSVLHELLVESSDWPRVVQCAQTVPVLLHIFFNTVIKVANEKLLAQLILVQLERSSLLLKVPNYMNEIHRVFSYHLLKLCKLHPSLVVDQSHELLDFAGTTSNVYNKEEIYTHVVWVLGEYLSLSCDSRCSVRHITSCFEALEAVLFEITSSAPPPGGMCPNPRVITTLMSALAKLASRSHDLIPRVSLFFSKLRTVSRSGSVAWCSDDDDLVAIVTRGEELWSLLKTPGVAQSVLTPPPHVTKPQWHRDINVAMPLRLRTLTSLTQPQ